MPLPDRELMVPDQDNNRKSQTHLVVATEHTAGQMARAIFLADQLRQLPGTLGIILTAAAVWLHTSLGPWALLLPGALVVLNVAIWRVLRQKTQELAPAGTVLQTTFTPTLLMVQTSGGRAHFHLSALSDVRRIGDYVVFRVRRRSFACPKEIFPAEEVERLRHR